MTDDDLEALLLNWGRWAKNHYIRRMRCFSMEGKYRSPQVWYPPGPKPPEIELWNALKVERSIVGLTWKYVELLKGHYVYRANPKSIIRKIHIRPSDYDATLQMARLMVKNRIRYAEEHETA